MPFTCIDYTTGDRVARILLNRPDKRNALHDVMVGELKAAFAAAAADEAVKVVILGARGEVFSAGADLQYLRKLQGNSPAENLSDSRSLMELFLQIYRHPKLVIACVEGHAIAGGCGLATVCDLCYATPQSLFGYSETHIGFVPALVSAFLVRKVGEGRARELLLTARRIPADEAAAMGMINGVIDKPLIAERVDQLAFSLCRNVSGDAVARSKRLLADAWGLGLEEALALAASANAEARGTADCRRGLSAFLNKEKLTW